MNTVLFVLLLLTGIANVLTTPVHVTIHGMAQSVESLCAADPNTPSPYIIEVGILPLVDTKYENTTLTVMYDGRSRYKRISLKNTDVVANLLLPPPLDDTSADNLTEQSRGATARLDLFKYELNRYPSNKYIRFHVEVAVGKSLNDTVGTFISYEVGGYVAIMCTQIQYEEDSPGCLDHGRQLRLINSIWPSMEYPLQNCTEETFSIDISCPDRPCFNGGKCVRNNATLQCLCPTSFHTGPTCEEIQCPHKPCKNGGSCQLGKIGKGPCKCPETHGGQYCEIELVKSQNRKLQTEVTTLQTENKLLKEKYNRSQGLVRKRKEFGQLLAGLTEKAPMSLNILHSDWE